MDVPDRPPEIKDGLTKLFLAIEQGKIAKARKLLGRMQGRIGTDPDLVKARTLIRRKEVLGK